MEIKILSQPLTMREGTRLEGVDVRQAGKMAIILKFFPPSSVLSTSLSFNFLSPLSYKLSTNVSSNSNNDIPRSLVASLAQQQNTSIYSNSFRISSRYYNSKDDDGGEEDCSFDEAVALFNKREYYKCHDVLEALWMRAEEPSRTVFHGILQCAVGFHHLFNKNHRGAMMELGEGLYKLKKMNFESGPFHQFEQEISEALDFIYQTQIELAACGDDLCLAMDQSERSYQLLGGYAAGEQLYSLQTDTNDVTCVVFYPQRTYGSSEPPKVKLPILNAREEHLIANEFN